MDSEEGQLTVLQTLELMIEQHVQDFRPYVLSDLEEKAKVNFAIPEIAEGYSLHFKAFIMTILHRILSGYCNIFSQWNH